MMPRYFSVMGLASCWLADCSVDIITIWRCRSSTPLTNVAKFVMDPADQQPSFQESSHPAPFAPRSNGHDAEVGRISAPKLIVTCRIAGSKFLRTLRVRKKDLDLKPRFITSVDDQGKLMVAFGSQTAGTRWAQLCQFSDFLVFRRRLSF